MNGWKTRVLVALVACSALGAAAALAATFAPLSTQHAVYGVSQLWAGDGTNRRRSTPAVLRNPGPVDHVAAVLVYDRLVEGGEGSGAGETEVFRGCVLRRLTPHAAIDLVNEGGFNLVTNGRFYAEVIAVPVDPVRVRGVDTRLADGLGITAGGGRRNEHQPWRELHPRLFSLPSNKVVEGQRTVAVQCICSGLAGLGVAGDAFSDFGVNCVA